MSRRASDRYGDGQPGELELSQGRVRARRRCQGLVAAALLGTLVASPALGAPKEFERDLKRVDRALRTNPSRVTADALGSCARRRNYAATLYYTGQTERAERSLKYCIRVLRLSEKPEEPVRVKPPEEALAERREAAAREIEQALELAPDVGRGLEIYRECAACHMPEGWGLKSGLVPQIAGQHRRVIIKQLADTRAGYRKNVLMVPYASIESIGGPQAVSDVAAYIGTLEMSVENGKGSGQDLELGKDVYGQRCAQCHGERGEGADEAFVPRIQSQHYDYLLRQFERIRDGERRDGDPEMVRAAHAMKEREIHAVLDHVSRLTPPAEWTAPPGWKNPDFAGSPAPSGMP